MAGFFAQFAQSWMDPSGPMVFLHRMQKARLAFIEEAMGGQKGLVGLDLGSGMGLVSVELAKMGHLVDSVEKEEELIHAAKQAHGEFGDRIRWICSPIESFEPRQLYDFIVCLEVLEHTSDPQGLCQKMIPWLKPGGHLILSTINRTNCAYFVAILGAEYIAQLLPKGTHDFERFLKPEELNHYTDPLICQRIRGLIYNPLEKSFFLGNSLSINYIGHWKSLE